MKILIINQHTQNHGDEAACLALVRRLLAAGYSDITVSYNTPCCMEDIFFIHEAGVKQIKNNFYGQVKLRSNRKLLHSGFDFG